MWAKDNVKDWTLNPPKKKRLVINVSKIMLKIEL